MKESLKFIFCDLLSYVLDLYICVLGVTCKSLRKKPWTERLNKSDLQYFSSFSSVLTLTETIEDAETQPNSIPQYFNFTIFWDLAQ